MDQNLNPIVSIVLPVYNGEKYLKAAIQSVLNQSFSNFEFIIVNDGSTDESLKIILNFSDPRIRVINQENKGLIATLNFAISQAKGKYIARIDADDVWSSPDKLQKQIDFLRSKPGCVVVGTWAKIIDAEDVQIDHFEYPTTDDNIRNLILVKNYFIHPSVVFSKNTFTEAGGFMENEKYVEDYGLWLRMGKFGTFANIPEYLMSYRIHGENITIQKNLAQCLNSLSVIKKYRKNYPNFLLGWIKWNIKILILRVKNIL